MSHRKLRQAAVVSGEPPKVPAGRRRLRIAVGGFGEPPEVSNPPSELTTRRRTLRRDDDAFPTAAEKALLPYIDG